MRAVRITIGMLLILNSMWVLFMIFAFSTLGVGGQDDDTQWWPTILGEMFGQPQTFLSTAGMLVGVGLCLYRPGVRMTVGRLMALAGIFAVLLGLFLRAATRERLWMVGRSANPDGTTHHVEEYRNWFGSSRRVEVDGP